MDTEEGEAPRVPRGGRRAGRRADVPTTAESLDGRSASGSGRANDGGGSQQSADGQAELEVESSATKTTDASEGRPSGWGEGSAPVDDDGGDKKFTGVSRRKAQQMEEDATQDKTSGMRNRWKHEAAADEPETILEIPELETEGNEDITFQVAEAPRARNKMQTMQELDDDQQYNLPSNPDADIDLSLLTSVLCSAEQVEENEHIWEPDILFTDVASELTIEAEALEENNDEEPASAPNT
mmetsp:Transcript_17398/g.41591  ORF Transcript_17398/g.41591 Transcript_17398/m.41591 type:complete len:240 (-) Transcript_17398:64-783(-)